MFSCRCLYTAPALLLLAPAISAAELPPAAHDTASRTVRLSIEAPEPGKSRGLLTTTRWPLVVRLEARGAPALIEAAETGAGRREAVVLADPDGCIDMREFAIIAPGQPYEDCNGQDETFFEFTSERFNAFDLADENSGNFLVRERLVDDPFADGALLNTPYLRDASGTISPLPRPQTGGQLEDGFGFGPDDDLVGLVLMVDCCGARVFDPDFNLVPGVIRNVAGFLNTVSVELLTGRNATVVTGSMHVLAGLFEQIALFDLDVADAGVDFLRRLESSPVEAFSFVDAPADDDAVFRELMATYAPFEIVLRAVLVEGIAPTFIEDVDGDGRYTIRDLLRMGFNPLSNQAQLRLRLDLDARITQTPQGRTCPPRSLIFADLDGNGASGEIPCSGSGGAARVRRPPR